MNNNIICINSLSKNFKVANRVDSGLMSAFKSLFTREYKYVEALKNIDFKVEEGEIRGLIGPNGAGKSTLIKIMSGVLYPSEGNVQIMGFTPWVHRKEYVKDIGVLFGQKSQLWWDLPAIDSFALSKKLYTIPDKMFKDNIDFFTDLLNVREVITKPVRQLSLGERMKCEFVNALLHQPKLVYLDEPTIGLDIVSKELIREFIKNVNKEKGTTFIITTHDISDIENLCKKISIINKGEKVFDDSLEDLKFYYENKKLISVILSKKVDKYILRELDVKNIKGKKIQIEIDLSEKSLKGEIVNLFNKLPIYDININSISIEEIIKQIYTN
ncbi:ABC transporter ATP-binding protein [Senegalia massiliensis]|uniref:ABC transporter ATP-binding protein n=1 Tax=Senegalia massiliensis TaxID=1720316 RepID=UPI00102F85AF|nr:ATP-binding cassette domain-containing protein [Senegalia massiliensis]